MNQFYVSQVIDSKGHTLFRKEDISKGKFAFTTEDYEIFDVCFLTATTGTSILCDGHTMII